MSSPFNPKPVQKRFLSGVRKYARGKMAEELKGAKPDASVQVDIGEPDIKSRDMGTLDPVELTLDAPKDADATATAPSMDPDADGDGAPAQDAAPHDILSQLTPEVLEQLLRRQRAYDQSVREEEQ